MGRKTKSVLATAKENVFNVLPQDVMEKLNKVVLGYCLSENLSIDELIFQTKIMTMNKAKKPLGTSILKTHNFSLKYSLFKINHHMNKLEEIYSTTVLFNPSGHTIIGEELKETHAKTNGTARNNN